MQDLRPCLDYEIQNTDYSFIKELMAQNPALIFYSYHNIAIKAISLNKIWIAEPSHYSNQHQRVCRYSNTLLEPEKLMEFQIMMYI